MKSTTQVVIKLLLDSRINKRLETAFGASGQTVRQVDNKTRERNLVVIAYLCTHVTYNSAVASRVSRGVKWVKLSHTFLPRPGTCPA